MSSIRNRGGVLSLVLAAAATAQGAGFSGAPVVGPGCGPDELPADLAPRAERMAAVLRPVLDDAIFRALAERHQRMMNGIAAARNREGAPVAACFAPGTSSETMAAFNRVIFAFQDRYTEGPRWTQTATNGPTGNAGDPIVLTYSFVPDGTVIPNGIGEGEAPSDLFARMNAIYGGNTQQWQDLYHGVFARWGDLIGVTYVYEPNDDSARLVENAGQIGVRGDLRLGGKFIDGNNGVLAYNYYPDAGDMVIDTGDSFFESLGSNSLRLRNVLSHEHGHGMGQPHVCPVQNTKLMEPFVSTAYDGPRHDDIRNGHSMYGDINEPNGALAQASPLGAIAAGSPVTFGPPAAPAVTNGSRLSIHREGDEDWYSFTTSGGGLISLSAAPVGGVYEDVPQACNGFSGSCCFGEFTDSASMADLTVALFNDSGVQLASADLSEAGAAESLFATITSAGTYFVRVAADGVPAQPQLYTLGVSVASSPALGLTLTSAIPAVVSPTGSVQVSVRVAAAGAAASSAQVTLFSRRGASGSFTPSVMSHAGGDVFVGTLNAAGCGPDWQYYVQATIPGASASLPAGAPSSILTTGVGTPVTLFSESFEIDPGWTVTGDASAGGWTHGEPLGTGAQPEVDHSADPLGNCYFTGQGTNPASLGEADVDNGSTVLTSTAFSATGITNPTIAYWRWYDNSRGGAPASDVFTVELSSDNGATWITASTIGPATQNVGGWIFQAIPVSSVPGLAATANMRIRFTASDVGTGSVVEAAIDDFSVIGLTCTNTCPADYNGDTGVDGDDVIAYFADWDAGLIGADFNGDGGVDGDDVIAFFARWDSGC
ncbi:MAG: GC-type dockerin domain-anchored protein [Phycisphaerales bacterium]